jgi:hypothetical protein
MRPDISVILLPGQTRVLQSLWTWRAYAVKSNRSGMFSSGT